MSEYATQPQTSIGELPDVAVKLLDYALCRSATEDEAKNAFARALPQLRRAGIDSTAKLGRAIVGDVEPIEVDDDPPGFDLFFPFGKHSGECLRDVWQRDRTYCRWFRESVDAAASERHADVIAEIHVAIDELESEVQR